MRPNHLTVIVRRGLLYLDTVNTLDHELHRQHTQVTVSAHAALYSRANVPLRTLKLAFYGGPYLFMPPFPPFRDCEQF